MYIGNFLLVVGRIAHLKLDRYGLQNFKPNYLTLNFVSRIAVM